ncbi:MAG: threonine/serine exporter family protein [Pirellulaceae bacterium]|jgi:uncharacterized membrane protein YjjP (DUF1212 family)|nr:threonine/serine exporter family protein [Pirellulaceae bacterium]MDP7017246.1 threonine/serine exporter family protein [Pirellulaceae bacterium]
MALQVTPAIEPARSRQQLVLDLARMLHISGMPAHELEERMHVAADKLGAPAQFFSTPTSIFVSFDDGGQETCLIRVTPASVNLQRLSMLHELHASIERDRLSRVEIAERMAEIESLSPNFGNLLTVASFGVVGGTAAIFFGGDWDEASVAGVIGAIVGMIVLACSWGRQTRYLGEMAAAFTATVLASVGRLALPSLSTEITVLASLIILLPGLSLTVAINELATQNLASGTARLAGAFSVFLTMAFGVVMGRTLMNFVTGDLSEQPGESLPVGWIAVALVISALAFSVLFQARQRDVGWILLAATISYGGTRLGGAFFGPAAAAWTGAFLLGVASNLFARSMNRPTAVMQVPGMILLVPGSIGFFSLFAFVRRDVAAGTESAFTMALVAISIVAGLLVANALLPSSRRDRSRLYQA